MYDIKQIFKEKPYLREIEYLKEEGRKGIVFRSGKMILYDYSILYIKEIWKDGLLDKYSYYWLSANNTLIIGWDNAPHHKEIKSFPCHKHQSGGVMPADEKDLPGVLKHLDNIFNL